MPNWKGHYKQIIKSSVKTLRKIRNGWPLEASVSTIKKINAATQEEIDNGGLPIDHCDSDPKAEQIARERMFDE
jgi:hypothetical protein